MPPACTMLVFFKKMFKEMVCLLPKLFWPTVRKKCSSDQENVLKFKAEGQEFAKIYGSLKKFVQIVKG